MLKLFTQSRCFLVGMIQWDEGWFDEWVVDHPPPAGVQLAPRRARPRDHDEDTAQGEGAATDDYMQDREQPAQQEREDLFE